MIQSYSLCVEGIFMHSIWLRILGIVYAVLFVFNCSVGYILLDHGGGALYGLCYDEQTENMMDLNQLYDAVYSTLEPKYVQLKVRDSNYWVFLSHTLDKKVLCKLRTDVKCSVHSCPIKNKANNFFVGLVACGNKSINFLKSLPQYDFRCIMSPSRKPPDFVVVSKLTIYQDWVTRFLFF